MEKRLQKPIFYRKQKRSNPHLESNHSELPVIHEDVKNEYDKIPIVCLLIGGGVGSISLVLTKIYQGIPILVFKGTGHAPDLISGTYEDFADRFFKYLFFSIFFYYFILFIHLYSFARTQVHSANIIGLTIRIFLFECWLKNSKLDFFKKSITLKFKNFKFYKNYFFFYLFVLLVFFFFY